MQLLLLSRIIKSSRIIQKVLYIIHIAVTVKVKLLLPKEALYLVVENVNV